MRQESPGTATPNDVEDGVQDLTDRVQARSPSTPGWQQERFQASEVGIGSDRSNRVAAGSDTGDPTGKTGQRPGFQTVFSSAFSFLKVGLLGSIVSATCNTFRASAVLPRAASA